MNFRGVHDFILAKWELYYSARETYGPLVASLQHNSSISDSNSNSSQLPSDAPLDAAFWHRLTEVFVASNRTFAQFAARRRRQPIEHARLRGCGELCKNNTICDLRAMRAEDSCVRHVFLCLVSF